MKDIVKEMSNRTVVLGDYFFATAIAEFSHELIAAVLTDNKFLRSCVRGHRFRIHSPKIIIRDGAKKFLELFLKQLKLAGE